MDRKLHNTILAFAFTGGVLLVGLMLAAPLPPTAAAAPDRVASVAPAQDADAIQARARIFEAELARAGSPGEMLAITSAFVAEIATEAALSSALAGIEAEHGTRAAAKATASSAAPADRQHGGKGRKRSGLAMPYFSFAQGLRGSGS